MIKMRLFFLDNGNIVLQPSGLSLPRHVETEEISFRCQACHGCPDNFLFYGVSPRRVGTVKVLKKWDT